MVHDARSCHQLAIAGASVCSCFWLVCTSVMKCLVVKWKEQSAYASIEVYQNPSLIIQLGSYRSCCARGTIRPARPQVTVTLNGNRRGLCRDNYAA